MKKNQIAAQLYTLRDYTKTAEAFDDTLARVAAIGYQAVQVSGTGPIDPKDILASAKRHGLQICATHVGYYRLKQDLDALIEEHRLWNCRYIGLGALPAASRDSAEGYAAFAREFSDIAGKLREAGQQFIYHNHQFEFEKFDGRTGFEWLMQESDPDAFHFELDTYWAQAGGADSSALIRQLAGRMKVIHLKDMEIADGKQVFAEIGEGNMNWEGILKACRDIGVEWYVVEQDVCRRDPFESLEISYRYLAGLAEG